MCLLSTITKQCTCLFDISKLLITETSAVLSLIALRVCLVVLCIARRRHSVADCRRSPVSVAKERRNPQRQNIVSVGAGCAARFGLFFPAWMELVQLGWVKLCSVAQFLGCLDAAVGGHDQDPRVV